MADKYRVEIFARQREMISATCPTITACRHAAEDYGALADVATIYHVATNTVVGVHVRDRNARGVSWFKATC